MLSIIWIGSFARPSLIPKQRNILSWISKTTVRAGTISRSWVRGEGIFSQGSSLNSGLYPQTGEQFKSAGNLAATGSLQRHCLVDGSWCLPLFSCEGSAELILYFTHQNVFLLFPVWGESAESTQFGMLLFPVFSQINLAVRNWNKSTKNDLSV